MKAVIFDLYETLVTEWVSDKYYSTKCADDLGIEHDLFRSIWESCHKQMDTGESTYRQVLRTICEEAGVEPLEERLDVCEKKRVETKNQCFTRREDAIVRMLSDLKATGIKLALCSNCSADEVSGFFSSDLYKFFDLVILSYQVGVAKPDEKIYQLCCERLDVQPSECLYVGDGSSRELFGAQEVGMKPLRAMWFLHKYVKDIKPMPFLEATYPSEVLHYLINP